MATPSRHVSSQILLAVLSLASGATATAAQDWPAAAATARTQGLDLGRLAALTQHVRAHPELNVHAILIVRGGRLLYEEYFTGTDEDWGQPLGSVVFSRDTLHDLRSISKSVTSALVGIAIGRGLISGVGARVVDLLPAYANSASPATRALRLRDLLTMSAGLEWDESLPYSDARNSEIQMIRAADPLAYVMQRPGTGALGSFAYNGGLTTLIAGILEARTGRRLDDWAREVLFAPLGIEDFAWHTHANGLPMAASGLRLHARDLARFGSLYLNGGRWLGRQIIPERWVVSSTRPALHANELADYGYQWWIQRYRWGGAQHLVPTAQGNGGQRLFVVRDLDLLVVLLAGNYNGGWRQWYLSDSLLVDYILPAAGTGEVQSRLEELLRFWLAIGACALALGVARRIVVARLRRAKRRTG